MSKTRDEVSSCRCPELEALVDSTSDLVDALPINDLFPSLITNRVVDIPEKGAICNGKTERQRVEYFIENCLSGRLKCRDTEKFYKFIHVMRRFPSKCGFLVERIEQRIAYHQKLQSNTDCITNMKFMLTHVIPRVAYKWEMLSSFLEYTIAQKKIIKQEHRGAPRECCEALLEDWIATDNGVRPKTWGKFVEVLEEIGDLAHATREIKELLKIEKEAQRLKEAAKLNLDPNCDPTEDSNDLMQSSGTGTMGPGGRGGHATLLETQPTGEHSQVPCTDDLTEPGGASYQEQGTIGTNALPNHPSYSPTTSVSNVQVGRRVAKQPHPPACFIVYSAEDDPGGDNALCLSDLLRNAGVSSELDLYHKNDNINIWSHWTKSAIEECIAKQGLVLFVCSPKMIALLEDTNDNPLINMGCGHIDRMTLRNLMQSHTHQFLPIGLDDSSRDSIPAMLSGKTVYDIPISRIDSESAVEEIIVRCASFRGLVTTLTGKQEVVGTDLANQRGNWGEEEPVSNSVVPKQVTLRTQEMVDAEVDCFNTPPQSPVASPVAVEQQDSSVGPAEMVRPNRHYPDIQQ